MEILFKEDKDENNNTVRIYTNDLALIRIGSISNVGVYKPQTSHSLLAYCKFAIAVVANTDSIYLATDDTQKRVHYFDRETDFRRAEAYLTSGIGFC